MPLPFPHNTTCDVYRTATAPPADPAVAGLQIVLAGDFRRRLEAGESLDPKFRYTHTALVPWDADVRDGFTTWGADPAANDVVYVPDRNGTAYRVVFVERRNRDTPVDHKKVYLQQGTSAFGQSEYDATLDAILGYFAAGLGDIDAIDFAADRGFIKDATDGAVKYATPQQSWNTLAGLTAFASYDLLASGDKFALYDVSAAAAKAVTADTYGFYVGVNVLVKDNGNDITTWAHDETRVSVYNADRVEFQGVRGDDFGDWVGDRLFRSGYALSDFAPDEVKFCFSNGGFDFQNVYGDTLVAWVFDNMVNLGALGPSVTTSDYVPVYDASAGYAQYTSVADILALASSPARSAAKVRRSSLQTLTDGVTYAVEWTHEDEDTDGYVTLGTDDEVITIPATGFYEFTAYAEIQVDAFGYGISAQIVDSDGNVLAKSGGTVGDSPLSGTNVAVAVSLHTGEVSLASGKTVKLQVFASGDGSTSNCTLGAGAWLKVKKRV